MRDSMEKGFGLISWNLSSVAPNNEVSNFLAGVFAVFDLSTPRTEEYLEKEKTRLRVFPLVIIIDDFRANVVEFHMGQEDDFDEMGGNKGIL